METRDSNGDSTDTIQTGKETGWPSRLKRLVLGKPRDLNDRSLFHRISLVAFLAWVGLGADGLSSSSYGPEAAFRALGGHTYLVVAIAAGICLTVLIISRAYSHIIEEFPHGGGGYVVATKLLGDRWGVISGSALVIDYVLTITVSIAASCDALFSFLPLPWHQFKLPAEVLLIIFLTGLNIRGVKESVLVLAPIFILFLITHLGMVAGAFILNARALPQTAAAAATGFKGGYAALGLGGMALLFVRAYSMGAGTYTGLEAVSNGLPIMREPKVETGKKTMLYMAVSLSFMAGGLLLCYFLLGIGPEPGKTLNATLYARLTANIPFSHSLVIITLIAEGALLVVGAQAGFIDGPRVLANMALDGWTPRSFSALSDRLTTSRGIILMGMASVIALLYNKGDIARLVLMYSINVFLTFSLSMFGMAKHHLTDRKKTRVWRRPFALFTTGFLLCASILTITVIEKFEAGGWLTVAVTSALVIICFLIKRHYRGMSVTLKKMFAGLEEAAGAESRTAPEFDPQKPTAALLVSSYGGLGIHSMLYIFRMFRGYYHNLVFLSVGVVDSGGFKGKDAIMDLEAQTQASLEKYVALSRRMGIPADFRMAVGIDPVDSAEKLCLKLANEMPGVTFFAGKIIFTHENWWHRVLHNDTALSLQKRLQLSGVPIVVIPANIRS